MGLEGNGIGGQWDWKVMGLEGESTGGKWHRMVIRECQ
jgi:hypothetical protein